MTVSTNLEESTPAGIPVIQRIIAVLWPSFIMSGIATGIFFTVFDPFELMMLLEQPDMSRMGAYSIGFFVFWLLTSSTCALTCYFQRPCDRVNGNR